MQHEYAFSLPQPDAVSAAHSERCADYIRERIRDAGGSISFAEFMHYALYAPGLGYYSAGSRKFGAAGDFVTAPELGSVFARCVARPLAAVGAALGEWDLLEIGAGTGALAAELLEALGPEHAPRRYLILERSADLRAVQQQRLAGLAPRLRAAVTWLAEPPEKDWDGVLLANEVLDALPVERFRIASDGLEQLGVELGAELGEDVPRWTARPAPEALARELRRRLGPELDRLGPGYVSELCTLLAPWLERVTAGLRRGLALLIDYGYPRREYYRPERADGTLVCHYRHRAHGDPFWWPGLQDLSAFVDFTAVAEAGVDAGLELLGYTSQAQFLIACGLEEVLAGLAELPQRARLERAREVRELTLPGAMGERFQCMALGRGLEKPLRGFDGIDLGHRL